MANPQLEDGFTPIANEILEAMARINLSSYQLNIVMVVWRKTYGWGKKVDWISINQIARMTGIHKRNVNQNVKKLVEKNMIRKNGRQMAFNKNHSEWKGLRRKGIDLDTLKKEGIDLDTKGIDLDTQKVFKSMDTKETLTKETIQKKEDCLSFSIKEKNQKERIERVAKKYELTFDEVPSFETYIGKIQREESLSFDVALSVAVNNYIFNQLGKQK